MRAEACLTENEIRCLQDSIRPLFALIYRKEVKLRISSDGEIELFGIMGFRSITIDPDVLNPQIILLLNTLELDGIDISVRERVSRRAHRAFKNVSVKNAHSCVRYFKKHKEDYNIRVGVELLELENKDYERDLVRALSYIEKIDVPTERRHWGIYLMAFWWGVRGEPLYA